MRRIIAIVLCIMLAAACACAESDMALILETENGYMLITENGEVITEMGEYDVIYCFTYSECPPERRMFAVASLDAGAVINSDVKVDIDEPWSDDGALDEDGAEPDEAEWDDSEEMLGGSSGGGFIGSLPDDIEDDDGFIVDELDPDFEWKLEDWTEEDDEWYGSDDYYDALYAVMNAKGELITDFAYTSFTHDVENALIFAVRADSFMDVIDEQGNVLMSGEYAMVVSDGQGGYLATKPDLDEVDFDGRFPSASALVHVAQDGTETDTGILTGTYELNPMACGYVCVPVYTLNSELDVDAMDEDMEYDDFADYLYILNGYRFIDANGADVFGSMFDYASPFDGGYAEVGDEEGTARLIGMDGNFVTDKPYSGFDRGDGDGAEPIIANLSDGGFDLLDPNDLHVIASYGVEQFGEELFANNAGDGYILAYSDAGNYILDINGNVIYSADVNDDAYAYTWYSFAVGAPQRIIVSHGSWPQCVCTLMDTAGNVIGGEYPEIQALTWIGDQGRYLVSKYDVIETEYDGETMYDADFDSYRYGIIDQDGNTVLETKYTEITCMSINRFWVCEDGNYKLLDENGNVVLDAKDIQG